MRRIRPHLTYANVMATIAVFLVLSGGTAVALTGSNTVFSDDIVNDQVFSADVRDDTLTGGGLTAADLRAGSVRSSEAQDNSLTGADVKESSFGRVPSALLGGLGRWSTGGGDCNPNSDVFVSCAIVTVNLPAPARVLLMGQATAYQQLADTVAFGHCRLASTSGALLASTTTVSVRADDLEHVSPVAVTEAFPAGQHSFGIDCNEPSNSTPISYFETGIVAVALSAG